MMGCRVEQCFNTIMLFDYRLQIPLHFGNTMRTEPCDHYCNNNDNCVIFLRSLMDFLLFGIVDCLSPSYFDYNSLIDLLYSSARMRGRADAHMVILYSL